MKEIEKLEFVKRFLLADIEKKEMGWFYDHVTVLPQNIYYYRKLLKQGKELPMKIHCQLIDELVPEQYRMDHEINDWVEYFYERVTDLSVQGKYQLCKKYNITFMTLDKSRQNRFGKAIYNSLSVVNSIYNVGKMIYE